jgi:hypothetical protein
MTTFKTTQTPIELSVDNDTLCFGENGLRLTFQRTLRIPDDGKKYPLPPGLGSFPIRRVDDYAHNVPDDWREHGGVFLPMYQREAMWLCFSGPQYKPRAVKVAVGKVCAITGKPWSERLHRKPQDYLVTPPQPWLDGIAAGKGMIRQFVAMPLGLGYTVEGQVTGEERFGGVQLKVFEPEAGLFPDWPPCDRAYDGAFDEEADLCCLSMSSPAAPAFGGGVYRASASPRRRKAGAMGLGAGGKMKQKIYPDPHGIETWDEDNTSRVYVHLVNSDLWREITGENPPSTPVTAKAYAAHGLPWFDLYDEQAPTLNPSTTLGQVKSIKQLDGGASTLPLQDDDPVQVGPVKKLWTKIASGLGVRDGSW